MSDQLCGACEGNGVVKIPGGISVCDTCRGRCYAPDPELAALRQQVASLTEQTGLMIESHSQLVAELLADKRVLTEERDRLKKENTALLGTATGDGLPCPPSTSKPLTCIECGGVVTDGQFDLCSRCEANFHAGECSCHLGSVCGPACAEGKHHSGCQG